MVLDNIIDLINGYYEDFDIGAFRLVLATMVANCIEGRPHGEDDDDVLVEEPDRINPVWVLLVGPPSSGKTEMIELVSQWERVYEVVGLTAKTLVTGSKGPPDLLNELNGKIVAVKDMSTLFSKNEGDVSIVVDQFRQIYDGKFIHAWGTGKRFRWTGKVGFVGAATLDIYGKMKIIREMGERFLYVPVSYAKSIDARKKVGRRVKENIRRGGSDRAVLRARVRSYLESLTEDPIYSDSVAVPDDVSESILSLAEFATRTRAHIQRDWADKRIVDLPQLEGPARMTESLELLCQAMAVIHERTEVTKEDLVHVRRAALGSIHPFRRKLLRVMYEHRGNEMKRAQIVKATGLSQTMVYREIENLEVLELARSTIPGKAQSPYVLTEYALSALGSIMQEKDPKTGSNS